MDRKKGIIIGAGISGLGAYYADSALDIYEADGHAGGLCSGFEIDGFRFDRAVHLSFSKIDMVKELFAKAPHYVHHPVPMNWYHDRWVKHPAQNNLYPLPPEQKVEAVRGFLERDTSLKDTNFADWNRSRYGEYLWEHFFRPYNRKYWDMDPEELDTCWIGARIYQPSLDEILYGSYTGETLNTYYAPEMRYPERDGYFSFVESVAGEAVEAGRLHLGKKVERIYPSEHTVLFDDGEEVGYDALYSSIPLPEMVAMTDGFGGYAGAADGMEHTSVAIVSIGMSQVDFKQMWFYIYDEDIMAARAYMPSVKSPYNVPQGAASIQFEIYFNAKKKAPDEGSCIDNCLYALKKIGICREEQVLFSDYRILPYGNVVFKRKTKETAENLVRAFRKQGIGMIGRFGRWEYLWSDQAFMSGYNAVKEDQEPQVCS